ncbi:GNAT family N-acetyltransferase [Nocardioides antri]|uniref:GNAT family N-acetyltransferase n=1 Tax=Nocardioides antri TaxID=2607659 RepID=A0A5B1MCY4_9ACTN|nr:GNAT family N-acetyltransferase [Nocardioides antri]
MRLVEVTQAHVVPLRRIVCTPEVALRWGVREPPPDWPYDDASVTPFAILVDGAVAGMIQYGEEDDPMYRHASIDIFLDPEFHGDGLGRDAVRTLSRYLFRVRDHHRIVIDPAADNLPAIRCYTAVGFRPVGVMRRYERNAHEDGWHDGLLMDLLAEELPDY